MYEHIKVGKDTGYIVCPAKIGVVTTGDGGVCLIDSGNDKSAGKKAKAIIEGLGCKLEAIYNTHSHADHIGGNRYLQDWSGCRIYAPGVEAAFTKYPILEPSMLYGGNPPEELRHKFLMAEPSDAEPLTGESLPSGFSVIPLPGHTLDMVGYSTPDGAVFLGDCLSSRETLDKYGVGYIFDVGQYLATLERVKSIEASILIPSHAEPTDDISPLCDYNASKVRQVAEMIVDLCREPVGFDALLCGLFDKMSLTMTAEQHALVGGTLRSYLTYLKKNGAIETLFSGNTMLHHSK